MGKRRLYLPTQTVKCEKRCQFIPYIYPLYFEDRLFLIKLIVVMAITLFLRINTNNHKII